ncbi:hypothetical protein TBLA_0D00290 [Henningerozyma blattae CBS 6284]|uniref:B box-type domain-containing protein n=1 Tax=Henningerozyma blattae (strain ATCC 34711 / CBS 6284 / DSM 70876 / NBRC 10599 / NRRL Y-10934 / UCD 77-7) TaxID=1071380 RepID=I2H2D7_HENB6|nr:hypothetical protein TBLA_0D00290 [Tetrapisispora blattae CBS 6284]CCH60539.1 hypothetical protein TBLA_0D00290 [Tetrapisispora blattae CBS 6284]
MNSKKSLKEILDSENIDFDDDIIEDNKVNIENSKDEVFADVENNDGDNDTSTICIECENEKWIIICQDCQDNFCEDCFNSIHKTGTRREHTFINTKIQENDIKASNANTIDVTGNNDHDNPDDEGNISNELEDRSFKVSNSISEGKLLKYLQKNISFIPMRLTYEERYLLKLLEATLEVSEYTNNVDILSYESKTKRIVKQLKELCSILSGLVIASNFKIGLKLIENKEYKKFSNWFKKIFEIGRRYKIMNPEKMKSNYGKLVYILMDSMLPEIESIMEFNLYKPINTIESFLIENNSKNTDNNEIYQMFRDNLILDATSYISSIGKTRTQINKLIKKKESAIETLANKYGKINGFDDEKIRQIIYSIDDFNTYTFMNRTPILRMQRRLDLFLEPEIMKKYPIGIKYGRGGSKLTHDHSKQYHYVQQSLMIWSIVQREMIHLWYLADLDLFSTTHYQLANTGHGLNRIKACPLIYKEMVKIIGECKMSSKEWIGSSVIHLGDHAVPNALFFLDKYIQIPNILMPFDNTINKIDEYVSHDVFFSEYITKEYGSTKDLKLIILQDSFTHMFDGSGADNFFMSGSCIDGRLTSAWNFCNELSKKKYYNIFLLTGFTGFNGNEGF